MDRRIAALLTIGRVHKASRCAGSQRAAIALLEAVRPTQPHLVGLGARRDGVAAEVLKAAFGRHRPNRTMRWRAASRLRGVRVRGSGAWRPQQVTSQDAWLMRTLCQIAALGRRLPKVR